MDKKLKDLIRRILLTEEALAEQLSHRTTRRPKALAASRIKRQKRGKKQNVEAGNMNGGRPTAPTSGRLRRPPPGIQ
jgi:hypothetical protein